MADKPDDRIKPGTAPAIDDPEPKIYLMVDNHKFVRPAMETYFAQPDVDTAGDYTGQCTCNAVGVYCSCNKVCSCNPLCSCNAQSSKSSSSPGAGGGRICTCVPVH